MRELFVEVVVAPRVAADALAVFQEKKNLRVVELPWPSTEPTLDYKRVRGGFLVQDRFDYNAVATSQVQVARRPPPDRCAMERPAIRVGGRRVRKVECDCARSGRSGDRDGAGQMSRVDSSFLAIHKARQQGHDPQGAVLASDAFFPFRDGVDEGRGRRRGDHPAGGSVRDAEVIRGGG